MLHRPEFTLWLRSNLGKYIPSVTSLAIKVHIRPASLSLERIPAAVYTSPDGSCLILAYDIDSGISLQVHHWTTFGSNAGITLSIPRSFDTPMIITSMVSKDCVHVVGLDLEKHCCCSYALDITNRITQFQFKEKSGRATGPKETDSTSTNNCLIDCHSEVWTRFPVIAAIQRGIISSCNALSKSLTFATDQDHSMFAPYFSELIQTFEQTKRKPTGYELTGIHVHSLDFEDAITLLTNGVPWEVSQFCFGEWLVETLCLIPLHVAITRDNRFIPLKNGVSSPELEKSLLGAEVGHIVDCLSLGWYESIFQSYMAQKVI